MDDAKLQFLHEHGWVVIPDVVEAEVCDRVATALFGFLKRFNPALTVDNPAGWKHHNLPPGTLHGGMNRCAAHLQCLWDMRQHPRVTQVFADLYGVQPSDLVVSFDGWGVWNAKAVDKKTLHRRWIHVDQGTARMPFWSRRKRAREEEEEKDEVFECVQSYVNLIDSTGPEDGTLLVIDKGHQMHGDYFARYGGGEKNWNLLKPEFIREVTQNPEHALLRVPAPKGALVLWYSRTPHQGQPPGPEGRNRAVVYVCQGPRALLTSNDQRERAQAWAKGHMTSHWPCAGQVQMFADRPLFLGPPPVELTSLGKSLLGLGE